MILGATVLPNPANTLESWWRNCRSLAATFSTPIQDTVTPKKSAWHGWGVFMRVCPVFPALHAPERHDARTPDTSRDRGVITQVTTQLFLLCRVDCLGASREWWA